jgi:hypothetical protein
MLGMEKGTQMVYVPPGITYPEIQKMADERESLRTRIAELEDAILDWHREDRDPEDQDRASQRLYDVAEEIRLHKGLDLGHNRNLPMVQVCPQCKAKAKPWSVLVHKPHCHLKD